MTDPPELGDDEKRKKREGERDEPKEDHPEGVERARQVG